MPAKKSKIDLSTLEGTALLKETCRRIRTARKLWDAHRNTACRGERQKALDLYERLSPAQREKVPQQLRVWLRYRSEKYFGEHRTAPGSRRKTRKKAKPEPRGKRGRRRAKHDGNNSGGQPSATK